MNKFNFILLLVFVVGVGAFLFSGANRNNGSKDEKELARVCVRDVCYEVEIAADPIRRERGLMFRQELGEREGMLFVFEREEKHPFWMKNTPIYLDILWMNPAGEIVGISENTPPCVAESCPSYAPDGLAKYVLEIAGGQTRKIGARLGDRAIIEF